jgi:hypothetical protein
MPLPLLQGSAIQSWFSVHNVTNRHYWAPDEIKGLKEGWILQGSGWA